MTVAVLEALPAGERLRVMTISRACDLWLGELERKLRSPRTVDTYRRLIDKLADTYPYIDVDELTTEMIRRFLDEQGRKTNGARKAPRTVASNVSIVNGFFEWLTREGAIRKNPTVRNGDRIISRPKLPAAEEDDNVVTIDADDVVRLLATAEASGRWDWRLCVNGLAYLGPRRHAWAVARLADYDADDRTLTFREKGAKTIRKPAPDRLADLIDSAITAGVYDGPDSYLVPARARQRRPGDRDDRVIWRIVKAVAAEAGVTTHVHALRAAFATEFLERKPGELVALKELMGHKRMETTLVYLRRLDRRRSMDTVRDLDWTTHVAPHDNERRPQIAAKTLEAFPEAEKEGFEPSIPVEPHASRAGRDHAAAVPIDEALTARVRDLAARLPEGDRRA